MSMYLVDSTDMTAIANAIRQKDGTQTTMTVSQMPTRIQNIPSGGGTDYMAERVQGTLSSYTIPNTCTQISSYAFTNQPISSLTIPSTITSIGAYGCSGMNIQSVTIPSSVTSMGEFAFSSNYYLTTVTFEGPAALSDRRIFSDCSRLKTLVNFSCRNIPLSAFYYTALEGDISLGDQCTVANTAFNNYHAQNMLYIHLTQTDASLLTSKYSFGAGTSTTNRSFNFDHCRLVVPVGMLSDYQSAFPNYSSIMMEETT